MTGKSNGRGRGAGPPIYANEMHTPIARSASNANDGEYYVDAGPGHYYNNDHSPDGGGGGEDAGGRHGSATPTSRFDFDRSVSADESDPNKQSSGGANSKRTFFELEESVPRNRHWYDRLLRSPCPFFCLTVLVNALIAVAICYVMFNLLTAGNENSSGMNVTTPKLMPPPQTPAPPTPKPTPAPAKPI